MQFAAAVLRIANIIRKPLVAGCAVVAAVLMFAGLPAHAACTVGGGAAIDGFAVGASVNCPTGTVLAGTVPPDGATITNKNFAAGSTTFTYTTPAVGTVQLAGNVSLTAATATPTSAAGAAAVANNNAQVEALFGGGNGGPATTNVPLSSQPVADVGNPRINAMIRSAEGRLTNLVSSANAVEADLKDLKQKLREYNDPGAFVTNVRDVTRLEEMQTELLALEDLPSTRDNQVKIGELRQRITDLQKDIKDSETRNLVRIADLEDRIEQRTDRLALIRNRQSEVRQTIENLTENLRTGTSPSSQFAPMFDTQRRRGAFSAFATSFRLSQLLLQSRDTRLGQTETNEPVFRRPPEFPSALDMFANISYSDVENDSNGAGYESKSWQGTVGLDYRLTDAWALGVFTAFTSNTSKTATINSSSESFSYLVGPFVRFNATPNITLSASISAGSTDTDLNVAGATSSFDSTQQLATLGIRGSWNDGNWTFAPAGGISYSVTRSDGFTDSDGNVNGSSTNRSGAINIGPTISYLHTLTDSGPVASVTPTLGINGTYNYKHSGDVTFNNGVILTSDDLSASLSPSVSVGFTNGSSASVGYTRSGIFSDVDGWSLTAGASAPVSLILPNLGPDATTGFQFTAEPQAGPTFMARLVIPLF